MQEIDESVKNSLRRLIGQCGSVLAASRVLGVSHSTVLFWLNGKIRHISTDVWRERVYPVLSGKCTIPADLSELRLAERCRRNVVPLVYEEDLLHYEQPMENICSYVRRKSRQSVILDAPGGVRYCAVKLDHTRKRYGMDGDALVFFTENICLQNGVCALLRFRDGDFVRICRFSEKNGVCTLECMEQCGGKTVWRKEDGLSRLVWAFPVSGVKIFCRPAKEMGLDRSVICLGS
ncbi:MAG: hypothetical protein MR727_03175 [Lentisphaeria bacterium]|nr:hypothetical protein [Lentisphaeria bacterium]